MKDVIRDCLAFCCLVGIFIGSLVSIKMFHIVLATCIIGTMIVAIVLAGEDEDEGDEEENDNTMF